MTGYLFIFFILLLTGIYFSAYQLDIAYPKFEYTLSAMTFVFLICVPILTMRTLAEERKQKTDQLLLTSPVSVGKIIMGKYLALVTVFAVPMAIICFYPLVMSKFGDISFGTAYTAVLGFFLLGCANLAIGVFISSLTESQVIAAVLTFVLLFAFFMMNGISSFFSEGSPVNLHYFRASDSGCIYYYLQHDKELCNLSAGLCDRRSYPCSSVYDQQQLLCRRYTESTSDIQFKWTF